MCDLLIDHHVAVRLGPAGLLLVLKLLYPERELYSISTGFMRCKSYIAKARGIGGDVVVGWMPSARGVDDD